MNDSLTTLLLSVLSAAAMRLPILIAVAVSVVWVLGSPRGQVRSVALWGLGLLGGAAFAGMVAALVPQLLLAQGAYGSLRGLGSLMGWLHFAINLVTALAVVLVVWSMTRALRDGTRSSN